MSIFGLFFIIIIIILVLGLSVISNIIRAIFGIGKRRPNNSNQSQTYSNTSSQRTTQEPETEVKVKKRKKFFDKSEGEYVEFEEVKDTEKK